VSHDRSPTPEHGAPPNSWPPPCTYARDSVVCVRVCVCVCVCPGTAGIRSTTTYASDDDPTGHSCGAFCPRQRQRVDRSIATAFRVYYPRGTRTHSLPDRFILLQRHRFSCVKILFAGVLIIHQGKGIRRRL